MQFSELNKNIWTELTPARLVVMPVFLSTVFLFIYFVSPLPEQFIQWTLKWSTIIMAVLLYLWGTKVASEAIIGEVNARTWTNLRMTSLKVWQLWLSKLVWENIYVWYGTLISALFFVFAASKTENFNHQIQFLLIMLLIGIFSHATTILLSFIGLRNKTNTGRINSTLYFIMGALIAGALYYITLEIKDIEATEFSWHKQKFEYIDFILYSLLFFTFWACVGLFRNIRIELMLHNSSLLWLLFIFSVMFYFSGFVTYYNAFDEYEMLLLKRLIALVVCIIIAYIMVFSEGKSVINYRRFTHHLKSFHEIPLLKWLFMFQKQISRWVYCWLVIFVLSIVTFVYFGYSPELSFMRTVINPYMPLLLMMFLTRDIMIVLIFKLIYGLRRSDIFAGLFLSVLYLLIPALLNFVGLFKYYFIFYPSPDSFINHPLNISLIIVQLIIAFVVLVHRWRKFQHLPSID